MPSKKVKLLNVYPATLIDCLNPKHQALYVEGRQNAGRKKQAKKDNKILNPVKAVPFYNRLEEWRSNLYKKEILNPTSNFLALVYSKDDEGNQENHYALHDGQGYI